MKKRIGLFLMGLALASTALVSSPAAATSSLICRPPACLIGPGCCLDSHCYSFCQNLSPGSIPHCSDPSGGCCSCEIVK